MVLRKTWIKLADSSLAKWVSVFHLYGGFKRFSSSVGLYVKGSVRIVQPPIETYKGFVIRPILKGRVSKVILVRQVYVRKLASGNYTQFALNAGIVVKKKNTPLSNYTLGSAMSNIRNKRMKLLFRTVV